MLTQLKKIITSKERQDPISSWAIFFPVSITGVLWRHRNEESCVRQGLLQFQFSFNKTPKRKTYMCSTWLTCFILTFRMRRTLECSVVFVRLFHRDSTINFNGIPWKFLEIKTFVVKAPKYMLSKLQRLPWSLVLFLSKCTLLSSDWRQNLDFF